MAGEQISSGQQIVKNCIIFAKLFSLLRTWIILDLRCIVSPDVTDVGDVSDNQNVDDDSDVAKYIES